MSQKKKSKHTHMLTDYMNFLKKWNNRNQSSFDFPPTERATTCWTCKEEEEVLAVVSPRQPSSLAEDPLPKHPPRPIRGQGRNSAPEEKLLSASISFLSPICPCAEEQQSRKVDRKTGGAPHPTTALRSSL